MQHYFSISAGGFFSDVIHGARQIAVEQTPKEIKAGKRPRMIENPLCRIPADAVEISQETWEELLQAQANGKAIAVVGGMPVAVEPTVDEAIRIKVRRRQRDALLAATDWTQMPDSPLDALTRKAWADYRHALRDLDMDGTDWPDSPEAKEPAAS
ncbi:tail fiber assembly protein [Novosphingobium naphthalenivorans]|uniref:tail fiber assembly protein n=1 Tax=Novosphingobium naphthalenivorans TaxID=273168 RepID=UPI000A5C8AF9|nr:tail fiber assembly protein [Novosphingobium naphthalenivorans]